MENDLIDEQQIQTELSLSNSAVNYLKETAKWANFIAILGFVGIGLMLLIALFFVVGNVNFRMKTFGGGLSPTSIGFIYIIMAGIYFFPVMYLYKFGTKMKFALKSKSNTSLTESFENLKSHYKFLGIFLIVFLSIYIVAFIGGFIAALFMR
ncbi:DUF5362 family protein [Crocinitomix algicola]|uniref:DUF5362 family protein n=1 Tax=Crocinitomix algicola TaxID=1740263 RepID=UPI000871E15B|nr:DUF5362 family protein [Crocinitomix algicola]